MTIEEIRKRHEGSGINYEDESFLLAELDRVTGQRDRLMNGIIKHRDETFDQQENLEAETFDMELWDLINEIEQEKGKK